MENKGIFLYLDSINALDAISSDAKKWRIVRAATMYAVLGELPDEKMQNDAIFLLMKSIVDNGKIGQKKRRGGCGEDKAESLDNRDFEASNGCGEKGGESGDQDSLCGEEKLDKIEDEKNSSRSNKNKNKNENKNKNSSSVGVEPQGCVSVKNSVQVEEEEKKRVVRVVGSPTLKEVEEFVDVTKVKVDPVCFFEYHEAKGWRVGGRDVSDWRACVLEWDRRERRKELREKEKEARQSPRIRNYTEEELQEIYDSVIDLSKLDSVEGLFS